MSSPPRPSRLHREVIYEETVRFSFNEPRAPALDAQRQGSARADPHAPATHPAPEMCPGVPDPAVDVAEVRRRFSGMFDHAAEAVFRAGYDLDDVIVERFVVQEDALGGEHEIEFTEWLRAQAHRPDTAHRAVAHVPVAALRIRVFLERQV